MTRQVVCAALLVAALTSCKSATAPTSEAPEFSRPARSQELAASEKGLVIRKAEATMDGEAFEFEAVVATHGESVDWWMLALYTTPGAQWDYYVRADGLWRTVNAYYMEPAPGLEVLRQHGGTFRLRVQRTAIGNPTTVWWRFFVGDELALGVVGPTGGEPVAAR